MLAAATSNVGRYARERLRNAGNFGTVEAGRRADLVLLRANPLDGLSAFDHVQGTMVAGRWLSTERLADIRADLGSRLTFRQRLIDRYEQLLESGDDDALSAFLASLTPGEVRFNTNVVIADANALVRDNRPGLAHRLVEALARLVPHEFSVWNAIGALRARQGDRPGAEQAYRRSLDLMPGNDVALTGLAALG